MRLIVTLVCLTFSLSVTTGIKIRQVRDADDLSSETDFTNSLDTPVISALRTDLESRQSIIPQSVCKAFYEAVTSVLPRDVTDVITAITIIPEFLLTLVFGALFPGAGGVYIVLFVRCWRSAAILTFGENPTAGIATLDHESINGNVFFAQTLEREDKPSSLAVVGSFKGLKPFERYTLKVYKSGDVSKNCSNVGDEYSSLGNAKFSANADGGAVVLLQEKRVALDGTDSVMGRSVVVTPAGGGTPICGTIVRNIVTRLH